MSLKIRLIKQSLIKCSNHDWISLIVPFLVIAIHHDNQLTIAAMKMVMPFQEPAVIITHPQRHSLLLCTTCAPIITALAIRCLNVRVLFALCTLNIKQKTTSRSPRNRGLEVTDSSIKSSTFHT